MTGTEKIIAHIAADAQEKADAILAEAKKQCADIKADYAAKAEAALNEKLLAGEKVLAEQEDSKARIAQMESKKAILSLKQEMVSQGFEAAKAKIAALPDADYRNFLISLALRACPDGGEGEVILNARDKERFGDALLSAVNEKTGGKLRLSEENADIDGGLILRQGSVSVNNSLELLVSLARNELSAQLAKILFE